MINLSLALHLGWLVRIIGPDFETKYEPTTFVKSLKQLKKIFRLLRYKKVMLMLKGATVSII